MSNVLTDAVKVYNGFLGKNKIALDYIQGRGLTSLTLDHFDIGSTSNTESFTDIMVKDFGYNIEIMESAGLVSTNGDYVSEFFRDCIIFPIKDERGRVINISGRKYVESKMKYLNLPKTKILDFYSVDSIRNRYKFSCIQGLGNYVFLCEGQMDTISLQQESLYALGILGVHNVRESMFSHLNWFDSIVLSFDNDKPGRDGALSLASNIRHYYPDKDIYMVNLPTDGDDISEFLGRGNSTRDVLHYISKLEDIEPKPLKMKKKQVRSEIVDIRVAHAKTVKMEQFLQSIGNYQMLRSGNTLKCLCPFKDHTDSVGSFTIYRDTNSFHCFGCARSGDVIEFCKHFFGVQFKEAISILGNWKRIRGSK
jgi:DNA primase catalytic core